MQNVEGAELRFSFEMLFVLALMTGSPAPALVLPEPPPARENDTTAQIDTPGDIQALVNLAVSTHPSVGAAKANVRAAGTEVKASKLLRFPSISFQGLLLNQTGNRLQGQAVIDQPLWTAGRISGTIGRAEARKNVALAALDEAVLAIASSTAQAFYEVHRWRGHVEILTLSLDRHNQMVATMERRFSQDVSPLSDLELARSRALQVEQQLYQARAQESAASSRLRELIGDPFVQIGPVTPAPSEWPRFNGNEVAADVLAYSPMLKRMRFEALGARSEVEIARSAVMPQLSGQYTYNEILGHRVGVVLKAQSDGGLSGFAAVDAARQRIQASDLQIAAGERQVRDQLYALLYEYESSVSRIGGGVAAAESAQRVMESYMRQFTSGRRTWLDVMNAVRESTAAEVDALDARISAQSALTRILLLSGKWMPAAEEVPQ